MMKISGRIIIVLLIIATWSCGMQKSYYSQQGNPGNNSAQLFYDQLSPYGHWVHNREYGYVWIPDVGRNFYPYATNGRWVMSDFGWTWVSDYEWGWAPFHYGRWDYDRNYGWFWFPGDEWGPAWVTWRRGDGYLGWSPLRPGMDADMRYSGGYQEPHRWIFVRENDFGRGNIHRYFVDQGRNDEIIRDSRIIDNVYTDSRRKVTYIAGPDPSDVERATGRRVDRVIVRNNDRPGHRLTNSQLQIYRPMVEIDDDPGNRPAPSRITDIKDIRPMRERDRRYQPEMHGLPENEPEYGQGGRNEQVIPELEERRREVDREIRQKQTERQRRQQEMDLEKRQSGSDDRRETEIRREQVQRRGTREQNTGQQKKEMERERKTREVVTTDTTRMKKTQREQVKGTRRNPNR